MVYVIPYNAEFECPKGHKFIASASPFKDDGKAQCPRCFEAWVAANVPNGKQTTKAVAVESTQTLGADWVHA